MLSFVGISNKTVVSKPFGIETTFNLINVGFEFTGENAKSVFLRKKWIELIIYVKFFL